ncbi:hypothetical protein JBO41_17465 [Enterobacter asburiae]|uniref:hypothetical protein n=1 Tax=Enterobacter asburiae TaxID=61645 RepID=UPI00192B0E89|nr:hypothetical protein [Enterobacter asburiae]MBL5913973.1 hypothetical protein [Enterobacter asburiae]MBL5918407.1 hypothetical protein [Enterobacter asburiae]
MNKDIEITASGIEVGSVGRGDEIWVSLSDVDVGSLLEKVGQETVFEHVELSDYVDWAEAKNKVSEILERLSPDEVISWLRDNGHLEDEV